MVRAAATRAPPARSATRRYNVRVFGAFSVSCDGIPLAVDAWPRRGRSLLRLLATSPQHRRLRDEVIEALWPDASAEAGFANLRTVLHRVHRALDPSLPSPMVLAPGWVLLNPDCQWEIDLEQFERLVEEAGEDLALLERAAVLAAEELLIEDRYEDWAIPVQERVRRRWREICLHLARLHQVRSRRDEALEWFERVLERDPLDEEAIQGLLSALGDLGRGSDAVRRYTQFVQRLEQELAVAPAPETVTLVAQAWAGPRQNHIPPLPLVPVLPSYPLPTSAGLVGQEAAVERLQEAVTGIRAGEGMGPRLLLVLGEAGIGKTRLLAETARLGREMGLLVLAGGCYEQEGQLPYGPVHDALLDVLRAQPDPLLRAMVSDLAELARLLPEAREMLPDRPLAPERDVESGRLRLFSAVAELMERLTREHPLVLLLDDLQWADAATLQLLHYLLRQGRLSHLLMVGAVRAEEVRRDSPLAGLLQGTEARDWVELQPLAERDLALLILDRLGEAGNETLVRTVYGRSGGNPLFALQMLRVLQDEGGLVREGNRWRLAPGVRIELPALVREAIARRLRRVRADEREALTLGAVLGRQFHYSALTVLWEGTERSLFAALDAVEAAHLVGETEEGYVFPHPLLWEVVYEGTPAARRGVLHVRAGLALERMYGTSAPEHAAELARHFLLGGEERRALTYAILAGDRSEGAFAHAEAEGHYRTALGLAHRLGDGPQQSNCLEKLGRVLCIEARYDDAAEVLEQAVALHEEAHDWERAVRAAVALSDARLQGGTPEEGMARLRTVLQRGEQLISASAASAAQGALASLFHATGRYGEEMEAATRTFELARTAGSREVAVQAASSYGLALINLGRLDEGRRILEQAIPLAEQGANHSMLPGILNNAAWVHQMAGELDKSRIYLERGLQLSEQLGNPAEIAYRLHQLGRNAFFAGHWEDARLQLQRAEEMDRRAGRSWVTPYVELELGRLDIATGRWTDAKGRLDNAIALARGSGDVQALRAAQQQAAELDIARGRPDAARSRLLSLLDRDGRIEVDVTFLLPTLAWACVEMGRLEEGERWALMAVTRARSQGNLLTLTRALQARAAVLSAQAQWKMALRVADEAIATARRASYPHSQARALRVRSAIDIKRGDNRQAKECLQEAAAIFSHLGAQPDLELTHALLASL